MKKIEIKELFIPRMLIDLQFNSANNMIDDSSELLMIERKAKIRFSAISNKQFKSCQKK